MLEVGTLLTEPPRAHQRAPSLSARRLHADGARRAGWPRGAALRRGLPVHPQLRRRQVGGAPERLARDARLHRPRARAARSQRVAVRHVQRGAGRAAPGARQARRLGRHLQQLGQARRGARLLHAPRACMRMCILTCMACTQASAPRCSTTTRCARTPTAGPSCARRTRGAARSASELVHECHAARREVLMNEFHVRSAC